MPRLGGTRVPLLRRVRFILDKMFGELERCVTILLFGTLLPPLNCFRLVVPFVQLQPTQLVCRVAVPFVRRLFEELFGVVGLSFCPQEISEPVGSLWVPLRCRLSPPLLSALSIIILVEYQPSELKSGLGVTRLSCQFVRFPRLIGSRLSPQFLSLLEDCLRIDINGGIGHRSMLLSRLVPRVDDLVELIHRRHPPA